MLAYPDIPDFELVKQEIKAADLVFVTEKIDGVQMRLKVMKDGDVLVGSRDRVLVGESDLRGFFDGLPFRWLVENHYLIDRLLFYLYDLGAESVTVYGEVYGYPIRKRIKYLPDDRAVDFRAFDIRVNDGELLSPADFYIVARRLFLPTVPVLYVGNPNSEAFANLINSVSNGKMPSLISTSVYKFVPSEGIVVKTQTDKPIMAKVFNLNLLETQQS